MLGINGVCMICHGGSNVKAIKNAIRFAHEYAQKGVTQKISDKLQEHFVVHMQQVELVKEAAAG